MSILQIVHDVRRARGSTGKLAVLHKHKDNKAWKDFLFTVYNPELNFYVGAPKDTTFLDPHEDIDMDAMYAELSLLYNRDVVGKKARALALSLSQEYGELPRLILNHSLNAGVTALTINKAYPKLIPTFDVMLAKDVPLKHWPVLASIKYDGVRIVAVVTEKVTVYTRGGKVLRIDSLTKELSSLPFGVYDGELISGDGKQVSRTKITGKVNTILKGSATDLTDYSFQIFDCLRFSEWTTQKGVEIYDDRLLRLQKVKETAIIKVVEQRVIVNLQELEDYYAYVVLKGYEGLICRYLCDVYEWKRTSALIKRKAINECILTCLGVLEGEGKYTGMIGALQCKGKIDGKRIKVKVGSGLSDFDRDMPPDFYIGHRLEILFNDIVQREGGTDYSLFLPRFKRRLGNIDT